MDLVRVKESHGPTTCAYCHDELEGDVALCPGCGSGLHRDCREALGRCPTLGCTGVASAAPAVSVAPAASGRPVASPPIRAALWSVALPRRTVVTLLALSALNGLAVLAAVASEYVPCVSFTSALLMAPPLAVLWRAATRVRRAAAFVAATDAGRVHVVPVASDRGWELELRFFRSGARPLDARVALAVEVPRWLVELGPRVPVGLHGELRAGALVVLEGPRGQVIGALVIESREPHPPVSWR